MAKEYRYHQYDFNQPDTDHGKLEIMSKAGWEINVAVPAYPYLAVLWERPVPEQRKAKPAG